jgi:gliding motility-associated lipoprotein GldD
MRSIPFILILLLFAQSACQRGYTPKPRGYLRIDFPEKEYTLFDSTCPYLFEYPVYAKVVADTGYLTEPCWINLVFPSFDGTLHLSYKQVDGNLDQYVEDSRSLAYKHTIRADAIREKEYSNPENRVYGIRYDIEGNTASSIQFYLTDSNAHFLRGSLYFNIQPDKDSLAPVISFFKEDIVHFIESFNWK